MLNLDFLIGRRVESITGEKSPLDDNGYRNLELVLDNGMTMSFQADDDICPYDPFVVVSIEVKL